MQYLFEMRSYASARMARDAKFRHNVEVCRPPIRQIQERFDLRVKNILSIGAGDCFEEYWLSPANNITAVDINDSLREFAAGSKGVGWPGDRYIVQDAAEFVEECNETFDLVYISSFAPDEYRREELQAEFVKQRSEEEAYNYITWRAGTKPYHPIIESALRLVKQNGLIILQHYRGGVDVVTNPHYLRDIAIQFGTYGVRLIEAYHFRASPQHLLVVATKRDQDGAGKYGNWLKHRTKITTFHGRYDTDINKDVVQLELIEHASRWKALMRPLAKLGGGARLIRSG
jgi:hypothetical protein